jgi:hypothetical protein
MCACWLCARLLLSAKVTVMVATNDSAVQGSQSTTPSRAAAVFRVDAGVSESALVQGVAGSNHRPSPHHRDRSRIVPLSQNPGGARKRKHRRHRRSGFYIAGAKEGAQTPPLPLHSIPAGDARTLPSQTGRPYYYRWGQM